jgi:hypothetical protein
MKVIEKYYSMHPPGESHDGNIVRNAARIHLCELLLLDGGVGKCPQVSS